MQTSQCLKTDQSFDGTRGKWTKKALAYINDVIDIVESRDSYWPLTLRYVYYQLVAALISEFENSC